jgi:tRNA pseudouridine55 synthase
MNGVLNVLKPPGMTSHDVVSFVRRIARTKRVGHTGTLDPAAAGVLPVCIGQTTRLADHLQAGRKTYLAEMTLGYETDTLDAVGETIFEADSPSLASVTEERLRETLPQFLGVIKQIPPMFSAIKQDGKKLYELARAGVEVEVKTREVEIFRLEVTRFSPCSDNADGRPRAMVRMECGSGTYVRSLIRDIGRSFGCGATMSFLVRSRSGSFSIDEASTIEKLTGGIPESALLPFMQALEGCATRVVTDDEMVQQHLAGRWQKCAERELEHRRSDSANFDTAKIVYLDSLRTAALLSEQQDRAYRTPVFFWLKDTP